MASGEWTIAILSPGEMGSEVGRALRLAGVRVVSCLSGRSEASARRAAAAGFEPLETLEQVVGRADLLMSIVPPAAAEGLAVDVATALRGARGSLLYVDANSIGPARAARIGHTVARAGGDFLDGAIIGSASAVVAGETCLYLSGPRAAEVADILSPALRTHVLGEEWGTASAFKVLYAGLTKGLSALGVELLAGAARLGLAQQLLEKYDSEHPGVVRFWRSILPGLPARAERRAQEMDELRETLEQLGLTAHLAAASEQVLKSVAERHQVNDVPEAEDLEAMLAWWTGDNP